MTDSHPTDYIFTPLELIIVLLIIVYHRNQKVFFLTVFICVCGG